MSKHSMSKHSMSKHSMSKHSMTKHSLLCGLCSEQKTTTREIGRTLPILLFVGSSLTKENYSSLASKLGNTITIDSNPWNITKTVDGIRNAINTWVNANQSPFILAGHSGAAKSIIQYLVLESKKTTNYFSLIKNVVLLDPVDRAYTPFGYADYELREKLPPNTPKCWFFRTNNSTPDKNSKIDNLNDGAGYLFGRITPSINLFQPTIYPINGLGIAKSTDVLVDFANKLSYHLDFTNNVGWPANSYTTVNPYADEFKQNVADFINKNL